MRSPSFMVLPSLACQASCRYCFGPHAGAVMDERTATQTAVFIHSIAKETAAREVSVVFHGGEPLLASHAVWQLLLEGLREQLAGYKLHLALQSNLWRLDDAFIKLLCEHHVAIGTSLDGPRELCDLNRGPDYFERSYAALKRAQAAGLSVSAIATITRQTLPQLRQVAEWFRDQRIPLTLHGALPPLGEGAVPGADASSGAGAVASAGANAAAAGSGTGEGNQQPGFALGADEYAQMLIGLFPWYVKNRKLLQVETLDHFVHGTVTGDPRVCTLRDCWGMFLAISPTGSLSSCQRFAGREEFALGNIFDAPTLAQLAASPAARRQIGREQQAAERCAACESYAICKGGCYYNALSSGDGVIDPWCDAYRQVYAYVQDKVIAEMGCVENIAAVKSRPAQPGEHPLLREGAYISLAADAHPAHIANNARRICAIHELGRSDDSQAAAARLSERRICGDPELTARLLTRMRQSLAHSHKSRNNCYVHVTLDCNLRCDHCYADAGNDVAEMPAERFERLAQDALAAGFRQLVVTGGEPLVHSQHIRLLDVCARLRGQGMTLVLRTNLTGGRDDALLAALARSLDQVVASVDGTPQTHDARRGRGSYASMAANIERYHSLAATIPHAAELSLACVMTADDINGEPGDSVRRLGSRLGIKRLRFRPLLPLGRAAQMDTPVICEGLLQHVSPKEMLKAEFRLLTSCGIGQNIFIKPDGAAHPCYAWCGSHTLLGNVFAEGNERASQAGGVCRVPQRAFAVGNERASGLETVLSSPQFKQLLDCSVDTIAGCRDCEFRYLCGGACRAWGNQQVLDINAAPPHCGHLKQRAQQLIDAAQAYVQG